MSDNNSEDNMLTVYYDGSCPLCTREIAWYKKQRGATAMVWRDVSSLSHVMVSNDLSRDNAMRRLHVRKRDGKLVSGAVAFSHLWRGLPKFRLLGSFIGLPVIRDVAEIVYRLFLKIRPSIQRRCK